MAQKNTLHMTQGMRMMTTRCSPYLDSIELSLLISKVNTSFYKKRT